MTRRESSLMCLLAFLVIVTVIVMGARNPYFAEFFGTGSKLDAAKNTLAQHYNILVRGPKYKESLAETTKKLDDIKSMLYSIPPESTSLELLKVVERISLETGIKLETKTMLQSAPIEGLNLVKCSVDLEFKASPASLVLFLRRLSAQDKYLSAERLTVNTSKDSPLLTVRLVVTAITDAVIETGGDVEDGIGKAV